jgi:hypothetical protein
MIGCTGCLIITRDPSGLPVDQEQPEDRLVFFNPVTGSCSPGKKPGERTLIGVFVKITCKTLLFDCKILGNVHIIRQMNNIQECVILSDR